MSFRSVSEFYEAYTEYVADLEERAGIPRPCPRCGSPVIPDSKQPYPGENRVYWVQCRWCNYTTFDQACFDDAWREHERNCKAEEDEG